MILLIKGTSDLWDFISDRLTGCVQLLNGSIIKSEMILIEDENTKALDFYGIVYIDSQCAGEYAILKLNGTHFKGKRIIIREYLERFHKDRRSSPDTINLSSQENRQDDRRRMRVLKTIKSKFDGV